MAERRKISSIIKNRRRKKHKEHYSGQIIRVGHRPFSKDLFQQMRDTQDITVLVKEKEAWEPLPFWDVTVDGKTNEEYLKSAYVKYKPFGVQDFFNTPGFIDLPKGEKSRLVEVSVGDLTGKKSDIRVVDLFSIASSLGLEPVKGKLGFEFEEAHREALKGGLVKIVARPSETIDELYFLSLQHDGNILYSNAWKINTQYETLRANQKLIFAIAPKRERTV